MKVNPDTQQQFIVPGLPFVSPTMISLQVLVTPAMAAGFLNRNTNNFRNVIPGTVERYTKDMLHGTWGTTAAPISFNTKGILENGQHRCMAVVNSGVAQTFMVTVGVPVSAAPYNDIGTNRTQAVCLQNTFGYKNAAVVCAAANAIRLLLDGDGKKITTVDLLANYIRPNEPEILEVCGVHGGSTRAVMAGFVTGPLTLAFRKFTRVQKEEVLNQLIRGLGLHSGTTLTALRSYLLKQNQRNILGADSTRARAVKVLSALMNFAQGVETSKIVDQETAAFAYFKLETRVPKRVQVRRGNKQAKAA